MCPNVQFGQCDPQLGPVDQCQVGPVVRVDDVDDDQLGEDGFQLRLRFVRNEVGNQTDQVARGAHIAQRPRQHERALCVGVVVAQRHDAECHTSNKL